MRIREIFRKASESLDDYPVIWTIVILAFVSLSVMLTLSGAIPWLGKYGPSISQAFITLVLLPLLLKLWFWSRIKQFMHEAMANSQVARSCGIEKYCSSVQLQWDELYAETTDVVFIAISGHSVFHGVAVDALKKFLARQGSEFTVVLADPSSLRAGDDFDGSPHNRRRDIERSVEVIRELASAKSTRGKIRLCYFRGDFKYTLWRFDEHAVYVPHPMHRAKNHRVPIGAMLINTTGEIWQKMLANDLADVLKSAREVSLAPNEGDKIFS